MSFLIIITSHPTGSVFLVEWKGQGEGDSNREEEMVVFGSGRKADAHLHVINET